MYVRTWNIGDGPDAEKRAALDKLRDRGARVICLQEAGDRQRVLEAWARDNGWTLFLGDGSDGASSVPILTAKKVVRSGTVEAVEARYVGPGAGPDRAKRKVINWIECADGELVLNTHMIASATREGNQYTLRRRHYRDHVAAIVALLDTLRGKPVTLVGDFNAPPDFNLLQPLRDHHMRQRVTEPTRLDMICDHVWTRHADAEATDVLDMPSDHRSPGARVTLIVPEPPAAAPAVAIPDPYAHSTFRGKPLDNATIAALKIAEEKLGYELTIYQGIGGASASAGTHTEGRAVDLAPYDAERKLRVLKDLGFAIWHRPYVSGLWAEHLHGILIFENRQNSRGLADVGFRQIAAFDAHRDGLVSNRLDDSYRPSPPAVFTLDEYRATFKES
jgi:exonuclease III